MVKTFLLATDWKVKRKVKELVLAPRLEENLTKDEILYLYLNQIYLGHLRYGVEEASRFYFGKSVRKLSLGEAATLAGIVQSPMRLSPVNHPERAKERQRYVLRRMAEEGFITEQQAAAEVARPIVTRPPEPDPPGAWYADAVRRVLDEQYGAEVVETEGLQVDVAMDPGMQRAAEQALEAGAPRGGQAPGLPRPDRPPRAAAGRGGDAAVARAARRHAGAAGSGVRLGPRVGGPGGHRARRGGRSRTSRGWRARASSRRARCTPGS